MLMPAPHRFLPPCTIDEANDACFIVRDAKWPNAGLMSKSGSSASFFEMYVRRWLR